MAIRQRHIYETAFDSRVKREIEDLDALAQSPLLYSSSTTSQAQEKELIRPPYYTPTEKRKVTLVRDSPRSASPRPRKIQVVAVVEPLPPKTVAGIRNWMSPFAKSSGQNSVGERFCHQTSAESNGAREECAQVVSTSNTTTPTESDPIPPPSNTKAFSPTVEFKKLDVVDISGEEGNVNAQNGITEASPQGKEPATKHKEQSTCDLSFRSVKSATVQKGFHLSLRQPMKDRANVTKISSPDLTTNPFFTAFRRADSDKIQPEVQAMGTNQQTRRDACDATNSDSVFTRRHYTLGNKSSGAIARPNLSLDLSSSPKRARQHLTLDFGCAAGHIVFGEKVDPTVHLQKQGWYHGFISRQDAENVLRLLKEGSYLVRSCENSKHDYSLSLKSARGFMHMKIVYADGKFLLSQLNQPFDSIPEMVYYYTRHRLPIHGAEHMVLLHPVIDQLL